MKNPLTVDQQPKEDDTHTPIVDSEYWVRRSSIFRYITPGMITIMVIIGTIIVTNFDTLALNFKTNVALNGLIIALLAYSIFNAIWNNFKLWRSACYLKEVDAVLDLEEPTLEDVKKLKKDLHTKGDLFDMSNMSKGLDSIYKFGILNFTDTDARLIKSKVGFRVRMRRGNVGFMAGILVMLGLLGTFWGLLAVGQAMGGMAAIDGNDNGEGMSNFIASLAAPLQGMGLAFSSSLFGLSGSLLIGFFNHLCGSAQNDLIEDISRWIDEHIPKAPVKAKKESDKRPSSTDPNDMKAWLAGFAKQSLRSHRKLSHLSRSLEKTCDDIAAFARNSETLCQEQRETRIALQNIGESIASSTQQNQHLTNYLTQDFPQSQEKLQSSLDTALLSFDKSIEELTNSSNNATMEQRAAKDTLEGISSNLTNILEHNKQTGDYFRQELPQAQAEMHSQTQTAVQAISRLLEDAMQSSQQQQQSALQSLEAISQNMNALLIHNKETNTFFIEELPKLQSELHGETHSAVQSITEILNEGKQSNLDQQQATQHSLQVIADNIHSLYEHNKETGQFITQEYPQNQQVLREEVTHLLKSINSAIETSAQANAEAPQVDTQDALDKVTRIMRAITEQNKLLSQQQAQVNTTVESSLNKLITNISSLDATNQEIASYNKPLSDSLEKINSSISDNSSQLEQHHEQIEEFIRQRSGELQILSTQIKAFAATIEQINHTQKLLARNFQQLQKKTAVNTED